MNVDAGMATGEPLINPAERIETYESGLFNSSQYSGKWNSGIVAENMDAYKRLVEEKKILYMKNVLLSTPAYVGGGLAGTLLSSLFTDSPAAISLSYIVGQEAIGTSAFWLLHVNDNRDLYFEKAGKFKWGDFAWDFAKANIGSAGVNSLFVIGKPLMNYYFQTHGYDPMSATLLTELISIPLYLAIATPVARGLGIIREKGEKKVTLLDLYEYYKAFLHERAQNSKERRS